MHAVILAGGKGTRLRSVVSDVPKPLAPVNGRPFLFYLLNRLESQGFTSITLSIGYLGQAIRDALGSRYGAMTLHYSVETEPLGTGGALRQALGQEFPVFVFNGDTYVEIDCAAMMRQHLSANAPLTLAAREIADTARYGRLIVTDGRITGYAADLDGPGLISCGIYIFSSNLLADWPRIFSFENDFLMRETATLRPAVYRTDGYFIDIGVVEDFARAQTELPERIRHP